MLKRLAPTRCRDLLQKLEYYEFDAVPLKEPLGSFKHLSLESFDVNFQQLNREINGKFIVKPLTVSAVRLVRESKVLVTP